MRTVPFDDILDVVYEGDHTMAVETEWDTPEGWSFTGPEGPTPRLHVRIIQLDACEAT